MKRIVSLLIALVVVLILNISLGACSTMGSAGSVTMLGPWSGTEEANFNKVLDNFERETGIQVSYRNTRALNQVLSSDVQRGAPPDIAILSSPNELVQYVPSGALKPLDDVIELPQDAYSKWWLGLQKLGTEKLYGVVVKVNLGSLVWFNKNRFTGPEPETWDELVARGQSLAGPQGSPWCLGMGDTPSSGWPGTDWIEDILLRQSGTDIYRQWSHGSLPWTSPEVRRAWETWGTITAPTGSGSALLTDFQDEGIPMFTNPPGCFFHHQPSFIMNFYQDYQTEAGATPKAGTDFDFFPLPRFGDQAGDPASTAYKVSADLATMFNDTPQARQLIRYLATDEAQRIWPAIPGGGAFSADKNVGLGVYSDDVSRRIATELTSAGTLCYDGAALMPDTMNSAFSRAVLEYLSDPGQLNSLLEELDKVRQGLVPDEWLDFPCGQ
ncbi:MAG: extracellular solute-binding protein [Actinobacteria bacterium]|nr:extracellular solute-binding protein [Actinomycetota bacterium]